ncbi:hypothetical protein ACYSNM_08665 [Myroides sp. LJL116]
MITTNCNKSENIKLSKIEDNYIESYEKWNLEPHSKEKQDSVVLFIDELIKVNKDDFYKIEKIKLLYQMGRVKDALSVFTTLNEPNSFMIELLRALIEVKYNSNNTDIVLQTVSDKYKYTQFTEEENIYKIALDYYLKGGDYAINEINHLMNEITLSENNMPIVEILQVKIQNREDALEVLYFIYNL